MNAQIIMALIDGALSLIERLQPTVKQLFSSGEITIAEQEALQARILALSQDNAFEGPEWKPDPS